jgi:hypothetical protein
MFMEAEEQVLVYSQLRDLDGALDLFLNCIRGQLVDGEEGESW